MALRPELRARPGLGIALTPGVMLGLQVMRLPPVDLMERLQAEVEANPLLVIAEPPARSRNAAPLPGFDDDTARIAAGEPGLAESLRGQLALMGLPPEVETLAAYLAADLDERGYLTRTPSEISVETRQPLQRVRAAHAALRRCDPAGVGARDLPDCLALQLERFGLDRTTAEAVLDTLEPLLAGRIRTAARALSVTEARAAEIAEMVRRLDLDPCAAHAAEPPPLLIPELRVVRGPDAAPTVALVHDWLPTVAVDRDLYRHCAADPAGRALAEGRLQAAEALLRAVDFRGRTLLRIGETILAEQADFFAGRAEAPAPLTRQAVAERLGLHASTVGRAVAGRAIEVDGRILPLERFFARAPLGPEGLSDAALRRRIAALVARERWPEILSDADLAERLRAEGVDIARRTVAKYRKCMSIPSSRTRRKLAARTLGRPGATRAGR